ncbi:MAG: hypothetical protein AAB295_04395, partial [Chloroflexota bacterium]
MRSRATHAGALAVLIVALACTPSAATPSPVPSASTGVGTASPPPSGSSAAALPDMSEALLRKPLPEADIFELTRAMRGRDGQPAKEFVPVRTTPAQEDIGTSRQFWAYDFAAKKPMRITATLRIITDHAKWWVQ